MKKKFTLFLLTFILSLSFTACSEKASVTDTSSDISSESSAASAEEPTPTPIEPSTDELFETTFSINGQTFRLPMRYSEFNVTGLEPYTAHDKNIYYNRCGYCDWILDNTYFDGLLYNGSINRQPLQECLMQKITMSAYIPNENSEILLPRNIQLAVSTKEDIIAAYGEPTQTNEYDEYIVMIYESQEDPSVSASFCVDLSKNYLTDITLHNDKVIGEFDNTIYTDKPLFTFDYVAPTQLSDAFDAKVFKVNEEYYSLPCPVSEFINNGYVISKYNKDDIVASGDSNQCRLELDGKTLYAYVTNYSDYATSIDNCHVTMIENTYEGDANILVADFSPGLKLGDSEDKVVNAMAGKLRKFTDEDNVIYELSDYGKQDTWVYNMMYHIEVTDGIITYIYFSNDKLPDYEE